MDELIDDIEDGIDDLVRELYVISNRDSMPSVCRDCFNQLSTFVSYGSGETNIEFIRSSVEDKQNRQKIVTAMNQVYSCVNQIEQWYGTNNGPLDTPQYNSNVNRLCTNLLININYLLILLSKDASFRASLEQIRTVLIKLANI